MKPSQVLQIVFEIFSSNDRPTTTQRDIKVQGELYWLISKCLPMPANSAAGRSRRLWGRPEGVIGVSCFDTRDGVSAPLLDTSPIIRFALAQEFIMRRLSCCYGTGVRANRSRAVSTSHPYPPPKICMCRHWTYDGQTNNYSPNISFQKSAKFCMPRFSLDIQNPSQQLTHPWLLSLPSPKGRHTVRSYCGTKIRHKCFELPALHAPSRRCCESAAELVLVGPPHPSMQPSAAPFNPRSCPMPPQPWQPMPTGTAPR